MTAVDRRLLAVPATSARPPAAAIATPAPAAQPAASQPATTVISDSPGSTPPVAAIAARETPEATDTPPKTDFAKTLDRTHPRSPARHKANVPFEGVEFGQRKSRGVSLNSISSAFLGKRVNLLIPKNVAIAYESFCSSTTPTQTVLRGASAHAHELAVRAADKPECLNIANDEVSRLAKWFELYGEQTLTVLLHPETVAAIKRANKVAAGQKIDFRAVATRAVLNLASGHI